MRYPCLRGGARAGSAGAGGGEEEMVVVVVAVGGHGSICEEERGMLEMGLRAEEEGSDDEVWDVEVEVVEGRRRGDGWHGWKAASWSCWMRIRCKSRLTWASCSFSSSWWSSPRLGWR